MLFCFHTAIDESSFCPAAQKAFSIIANNVLRVAAINSVGAFVLFLGKIGVMAATCAVSVIWLRVPTPFYLPHQVINISTFQSKFIKLLLSYVF
jgi:hypothetical protein